MKPEKIIFIFILLVFIITQLTYIPLDMWNDEVYTFIHFVLKPYNILLSDYHVPNNHVFLNILQKLICSIFSLHTLQDVLTHVYIFRIFQVVLGITSFILLYKTISKIVNRHTALITLIILVGTLPYLNFVSQLRGYNISVFMYIVMLYVLFLKENECNILYKLLFTITVILLMYTVPSNIYILIATAFSYLLYQLVNNDRKIHIKTIILQWMVKFQWMLYGFLLSLILYIPMIDKVFKNEYVSYHYFDINRVKELIYPTMKYFLSHRYELIIFIAISFFIVYKKNEKLHPYFIFFFFSILTPFLIIFITGNNVPDRILLPFTIPFAISISLLIAPLVQLIHKKNIQTRFSIMLFLLGLFIFHLFYSINDMKANAYHDIVNNGRTQNLNYNYYQANFHPLQETKNIAIKYGNRLPISVVGCEPNDIPHYLSAYHLHFVQNALDSLFSIHDSILVVTNHPLHLQSNCATDTLYQSTNLSRHNCYHTCLMLYKSSL